MTTHITTPRRTLSTSSRTSGTSPASHRVVIVDTGYMEISGDIYEAADGLEAVQALESHWIDIVFADINMPRMNGLQLVDEMASRGLLDATPVIIISTERSLARIAEFKAKGISAYLNKPFTPENIRQVVENLLGASHEQSQDSENLQECYH